MTNASGFKKKRILYVITKSNFGGAQMYVYDLATAMQTAGHEVTVACGPGGSLIDKLATAGIETKIIPAFARDIHIGKEIQSWFQLWRIIRSVRPDIIHTNSPKAGGSAAFVARLCRVPTIMYTAHGWPFFEQRSWLWRKLAWIFSYLTVILSHKIICVSTHDCTQHGFGGKKKFTLIHNGVSLPTQASSSDIIRTRSSLNILSVAELNHNKNIAAAIDAVAQYNQSHEQKISYYIMGDGEDKATLQTHIETVGAGASIHLLGFVHEPFQYLSSFDALLMPSRKEGLPYALLFANAAGLPMIGTRVGGIPDIITSENGLLLNKPTPAEIEKALVEIADEATRAKLTNNPKRPVFTLETMIEKTHALYSKAASLA